MQKYVSVIILIIAILILNFNPVFADDIYITDKVSHIYAQKNGEIIGSLKKGFVLTADTIIKEENGWLKIKISKDKLYFETWIKTKNFEEQDDNHNFLSDNKISKEKFEFTEIQFRNQPGIGFITFIGNAKNNTDKKISTVEFLFTIFNNENKKIDSTTAKIININPQESKYISGHLSANLDQIDHYQIKIIDKH